MAPPQVGDLLDGKYRIDAIIGSGNIGVVARARHLLRDADVAIKFLRAHDATDDGPESASSRQEIVERFRLEAIASSRLRTDHVVQVHDVGATSDGTDYLVMEHLVGSDLERVLARSERLSTARSLHIVLQAARALAVAHDAGVIHRDLKPGNIFLCERDGATDFVKILDFGISKLEPKNQEDSLRLTAGAVGMGTPLYMAPEQARDARSATPASDIYSLGAVLYECISGKPPLDASSTVELLYKLVHETPKRLDETFEVPAGLASAVARALEKDPTKRPSSMEEFAALLAPFADERSDRALASLRLTPRGASVRTRPDALGQTARRSLAGTHFAHDVSDAGGDALHRSSSSFGFRRAGGGRTRWELVAAFGALTVVCFALGTYLTGRVARSTGLTAALAAQTTHAAPPSSPTDGPLPNQTPDAPSPSSEPDGADAAASASAAPPASSAPPAPAHAPARRAGGRATKPSVAPPKPHTKHGSSSEQKPPAMVPYEPTINLADNPSTADLERAAAAAHTAPSATPPQALSAATVGGMVTPTPAASASTKMAAPPTPNPYDVVAPPASASSRSETAPPSHSAGSGSTPAADPKPTQGRQITSELK